MEERHKVFIQVVQKTEENALNRPAAPRTPRIALIEVSAVHLSERYRISLERCSKWKFSLKHSFFNNFCCLFTVGLHVEQCSYASGSQSAHSRNEQRPFKGQNPTVGPDRNTSSRQDFILCDAERPLVSTLCIKFLCAMVHDPQLSLQASTSEAFPCIPSCCHLRRGVIYFTDKKASNK